VTDLQKQVFDTIVTDALAMPLTTIEGLNPDKLRLVFLDIDGVLISTKSALVAGGWGRTLVDYTHYDGGWFNSPQRKEIKEPYLRYPESIDKHSVWLLNRLLEATNSHIVLSSTWRLGLDLHQIKLVLGAMGINTERVIGRTMAGDTNRGGEIFNFLQGMGEKRLASGKDWFVNQGWLDTRLEGVEMNVESYVIIDDVVQFTEEQKAKHFVKTDEHEGLSLGDVLLAGAILTGKDFDVPQLQNGEHYEGKLIVYV